MLRSKQAQDRVFAAHAPWVKPLGSDWWKADAGIQRTTPVFHPRMSAKMNTIKKKKRQPLPTDRLVL